MRERDTSDQGDDDSAKETLVHKAQVEIEPIPPVWSFVRGFAMVGAGMTFIACDEEHTGMLLVGTGLLMLNHYRNRSKTHD